MMGFTKWGENSIVISMDPEDGENIDIHHKQHDSVV
jgi:hypothetical protein